MLHTSKKYFSHVYNLNLRGFAENVYFSRITRFSNEKQINGNTTRTLQLKAALSGEVFKERFIDIFHTNIEQVAFSLELTKTMRGPVERAKRGFVLKARQLVTSFYPNRALRSLTAPKVTPSLPFLYLPVLLYLPPKGVSTSHSGVSKGALTPKEYVSTSTYSFTYPCSKRSIQGLVRVRKYEYGRGTKGNKKGYGNYSFASQIKYRQKMYKSKKTSFLLKKKIGDYLSSGDKIGNFLPDKNFISSSFPSIACHPHNFVPFYKLEGYKGKKSVGSASLDKPFGCCAFTSCPYKYLTCNTVPYPAPKDRGKEKRTCVTCPTRALTRAPLPTPECAVAKGTSTYSFTYPCSFTYPRKGLVRAIQGLVRVRKYEYLGVRAKVKGKGRVEQSKKCTCTNPARGKRFCSSKQRSYTSSKERGHPIVLSSSGRVVTISKTQLIIQKTQPVLFYNSANLHVKKGEWVREGSPILTLTHQTLITGDIVQGIPRIEQLFEAFTSPPSAFKDKERSVTKFKNVHDTLHSRVRDIFRKHWFKSVLPIAVRKSLEEIQYILVESIQKVYLSQGVLIADKHIEIIIRQIASKGQILDSGTTGLFLEEILPIRQIENANLATPGKKCLYVPAVVGLTAASLSSDSFISAASFQETTRVLSRDAVAGKSDFLRGLKEKVVIGDLISAGTGLDIYFIYTTMMAQ